MYRKLVAIELEADADVCNVRLQSCRLRWAKEPSMMNSAIAPISCSGRQRNGQLWHASEWETICSPKKRSLYTSTNASSNNLALLRDWHSEEHFDGRRAMSKLSSRGCGARKRATVIKKPNIQWPTIKPKVTKPRVQEGYLSKRKLIPTKKKIDSYQKRN